MPHLLLHSTALQDYVHLLVSYYIHVIHLKCLCNLIKLCYCLYSCSSKNLLKIYLGKTRTNNNFKKNYFMNRIR